jgi:hypothetical protein
MLTGPYPGDQCSLGKTGYLRIGQKGVLKRLLDIPPKKRNSLTVEVRMLHVNKV